ncbi:MAG: methylated-DNA--[protein]-cysteine S-methyltransferase [Deltaproteobacteria bacterium]|nr:methylated-DNA--[protein]-cysteine S-methyltransferase [Candidatus Tharpella sp.]
MQKIHKTIIKTTPYGPVVLVWSLFDGQPRIVRIIIPKPASPAEGEVARLFPDIVTTSCPAIDLIASRIEAYLAGEEIAFSLDLVKLNVCSDFQQAVLQANHAIPHGGVSSYGLLAAHLGKTKAARAVGGALATNPFPILIPCHRVIRSDRTLGGFGGGLQMKKAMLAAEGVTFDKTGRVNKFHLL